MKKLYHKIDYIDEGMIALVANNVSVGERACIHHSNGTTTKAVVLLINDRLVFLPLLEHAHAISTHDSVEFLGTSSKLTFAHDLMLGRTFNALGEPLDQKPAIVGESIALPSPPWNPLAAIKPHKKLALNTAFIDGLSPVYLGESCTILSSQREPHHQLLASIAQHADADVIVVAMMGLHPCEVQLFQQQLLLYRHKTIVFCHTHNDTPSSCTTLPDYAMAAAEQYALMGARVVVLMTDLAALALAHTHIHARINARAKTVHHLDRRGIMARLYDKAIAFSHGGSLTLIGVATELDAFRNAIYDVSDHVIQRDSDTIEPHTHHHQGGPGDVYVS